MFALMARAAHPQATEQLFLKNGMSEAAIRDHEIQKNSDMIDFCTTTYSSIRNREYCIDVSPSPAPFLPHPAHCHVRSSVRVRCTGGRIVLVGWTRRIWR